MKIVFRYVPYKTAQDPGTEPTYEAQCVSGDDKNCNEKSGVWITPHPVEVWMDAHLKETGHRYYRRSFHDNAIMEPVAGVVAEPVALPADLEPARVHAP